MENKNTLKLISLALLAILMLSCNTANKNESKITNFEECAKAGNPIMESYPEQCRTTDGKTFVNEIGEKEDDKIIEENLEGMLIVKTIETGKGQLTLSYKDGTNTLSGTLARNNPCVEWNVQAISTKDFPTSHVSINLLKTSTSEICVQSLGKPQEIKAEISGVSEKTDYQLTFENEILFSGKLTSS